MAKKGDDDPALRLDHDPEDSLEEGMSAEAEAVDRAETLASAGDADGSFQETAAGSATGVGVDRAEPGASAIRPASLEALGTTGPLRDNLDAPPDIDENDGDDSWLQDFPEDMK